jgi:hypothetical protein
MIADNWNDVLFRHLHAKAEEKMTKNLNQDSRCPGEIRTERLTITNLIALPLRQPAVSHLILVLYRR